MTIRSWSSLATILATLAIASSLAGCASDVAEEQPTASAPSNGRLTLTEDGPTRAAGTFDATEEGDGQVAFEVTRDRGVRSVTIRSNVGQMLFESTRVGSEETVSLLDGRARLSGDVANAEPKIEGDASAREALAGMKESRSIGALHGALVDAHASVLGEEVGVSIQGTTYTPPRPAPTYPTTTSPTLPVFYGIDPGNSRSFSTWVFGGTKIIWRNSYLNPSACIALKAGAAAPVLQCTTFVTERTYTGYWAGLAVSVKNESPARILARRE
jgi:hypothetical protein